MSRRLAALNRAIVLVLGLALIGCAAYALAWNLGVTAIRDLVARYDREAVVAVPTWTWWPWLLAGVLVAALVFGIVLLSLDLTRRRPHPVRIVDPESGLSVAIDLGALADGIAGELREFPEVRSVRARALVDRGLPTLSLVVNAHAGIDILAFTARAEETAAWIAATVQDADIATQVRLHLDPADHHPSPAEEEPATH